MLVPFDKFSAGLTQYIISEVIPKATGGNVGLMAFFEVITTSKAPDMIKALAELPAVKVTGIVGEGGVDLDLLCEAGKAAVSKDPNFAIDIPYLPFKLKPKMADIERLNQLCGGTGETK